MPIEIKELHIKVSVTPPAGADPSASSAASSTPATTNNKGIDDKMAEFVEQVFQILQQKKER